MCVREERGAMIAAVCKIVQKGAVWLVPSQTEGGKKYTVSPDEQSPYCSCEDHETRGVTCKHIYAVRMVMKRELHKDESEPVMQIKEVTTTKRATYPQKWKEYNAAQVNEKRDFQLLLRDLCSGLPEPKAARGNQSIRLSDAVFSAVFKVYTTVSGRRFMSDLTESHANGFIGKCPCYNSIFKCLENPDIAKVLTDLIIKASLPLQAIETDFAVDSSGFSASKFVRWFDHKYGTIRQEHDWVKAHIAIGVKTQVVTAVEIHERNTNDSPIMPSLLNTTAANFKISEVSADKQYASHDNFNAIASHGADGFIKFRAGTTGGSGGIFGKAFHFCNLYREEFLQSYHKRSSVESAFSMMKRKFGDSVRSKTQIAMKNEVLCKVLCHNICCLISAMYELGIEPKLLAV